MTRLLRFTDPQFNLQEFFDTFFSDFNFQDVNHSFDGFPLTNIYVNEDRAWKMEMALAGWNKKSIDISVEDGSIIIEGKRKYDENENDSWKLISGKIKKSSFRRQFRISNKLDIENTKVFFEDGILSIEIPAKEETKPKKLSFS